MSARTLPVITSQLPKASRAADAASVAQQFLDATGVGDGASRAVIEASAGNSPFIARLITKFPDQMAEILADGVDESWHAVMAQLASLDLAALTQPGLMKELRALKSRVALVTAIADISGHWELLKVTRALSDFAEGAVQTSLRFLLHQAVGRGEFAPADRSAPETGSGIIVLGMGKLGGYELNYSSDIDLIILFDKDQLPYQGSRNAQVFMNKLATDMVAILQERTPEGYVFRTDLRLRPDPISTPPAVTVAGAIAYYETVGQNWERAAMIKARPVAGDRDAAGSFLRELIPFIWRKTLDFATIADIHSIKRQMTTLKGGEIDVPGHNVKTGIGGIREIEFFAATQQLVWGGRIPELRVRSTLDALAALTEFGLVDSETHGTLREAYYFLRTVEHRLQMRNDEQTHELPLDAEAMRETSIFCGYETADAFQHACSRVFSTVHDIYTDSMGTAEPLSVEGNLVFTGVEADAGTLKTLGQLGYTETKRVSDIIQGWHRGHRKSTRSKRSRQVLTELIPALLTALGKTANPDQAFFHFDHFIDRLPSGAQIFALLIQRPELLSLLADILGSAPALGDKLSSDPALLDSVLEADFFLILPSKEELQQLVTDRLRYALTYEQKMGYLRIFNNEKRFQAGVHLLKRLATPKRVSTFLSDLAEVVLQVTMQQVWEEYASSHAGLSIPFAVVAMGKLGGRSMTFGSDLDIVFLYDDAGETASDARIHMQRISQRLVSALTLLTREGRLYEVDTRLRPGGSDGPLATSLAAFDAYFLQSAWTFEFMALTRGRVVASNNEGFAAAVRKTIRRHILAPRDGAKLLKDVTEMRRRIAREFPTKNPWALKHVRGGMVDMDFIAQYLVLRHAPHDALIWNRSTRRVYEQALLHGILDEETALGLIAAKKFLTDLFSLLRLSAPGGAITDDAPPGLKRLLVHGMRVADFDALKAKTLAMQATVIAAYEALEAGKFG